MTKTVNIKISNCPAEMLRGYEVLTLDNGIVYHYGLYPDEYSAQAAVDEFPESRFMVEIA